MTQRLALLAAAATTAFIVVFTGALVTYTLIRAPRTSEVVSSAPTPQVSDVAAALPTPPSALPTPTSALPVPPGESASGQTDEDQNSEEVEQDEDDATEAYAVSADQAAGIALRNAPGASLIQEPRLVNLNGAVAYEVPLDSGNVYVAAASGQVLYNTTSSTNESSQRPRRHRR
jgi:hypothetical protein